jgi:hypothetical protein
MFHLTTAQRVANAKKSAKTRLLKHERPFGGHHSHGNHMTHEQRSEAAKKAVETRRKEGKEAFSTLTHPQRVERAKHAAETRKREGIRAFGGKHGHHHGGWHLTPSERIAAHKKAAATRLARHER